ncbi:DUF3800 domain-containing protein [Bacillus sp. ISL-53]|nr:DUF3800 domain-containing protein [Bacillus sp. ISL-53]
MKYFIFLDDSGQLHPSYPYSDFFVYGGLLVKESDFHKVNAGYKKLVKTIKKEKKIEGELKTSNMSNGTRTRLLKGLSNLAGEQIFVTVKVSTLIRLNFENKRDVVRYKNYMVKRLVQELIDTGKLPQHCSFTEIQIDNQNVAHSAQDSLQDYLFNIFNEDNYYQIDQPYHKTSFQCDFRVLFKDSSNNYLVQAADLLANTQAHIIDDKPELERFLKENHTVLKLPDKVTY